ncbi:MAG: GIY-YIG nuclease family protein [Flavobacteriales bacterium]
MFYVYIIYSQKLDRYYVGHTEDLANRLLEHNSGISTYTSKANDWILKYKETFGNRVQAHTRELVIKRKKSRKYIEWVGLTTVQLSACMPRQMSGSNILHPRPPKLRT